MSFSFFQNHLGPEYAVCPFNARHEVSSVNFRYHVASCPDKALVEQDINCGMCVQILSFKVSPIILIFKTLFLDFAHRSYLYPLKEEENIPDIPEGSRRVKLCDWQPPPTDEDWSKGVVDALHCIVSLCYILNFPYSLCGVMQSPLKITCRTSLILYPAKHVLIYPLFNL